MDELEQIEAQVRDAHMKQFYGNLGSLAAHIARLRDERMKAARGLGRQSHQGIALRAEAWGLDTALRMVVSLKLERGE